MGWFGLRFQGVGKASCDRRYWGAVGEGLLERDASFLFMLRVFLLIIEISNPKFDNRNGKRHIDYGSSDMCLFEGLLHKNFSLEYNFHRSTHKNNQNSPKDNDSFAK